MGSLQVAGIRRPPLIHNTARVIMMNKYFMFSLIALLLVGAGVFYTANNNTQELKNLVENRWYTQSQLRAGKTVFQNNCMVCHGDQGQSLGEDWKMPERHLWVLVLFILL